MNARTLSETLAEYIAGTRFDALPPEAVAMAKRMVLDTLAVAWAGADAEGVPAVRDGLLAGSGIGGGAALWGARGAAAVLDCAFLNSLSAAALDYDSLHVPAVIHPDIVTLPALLATAQSVRADGKALLAALVLADDLACRLSLSTREFKGWWYTSLHGVFGAAAGGARLLRLDAAGIANALGIALSQAGGTQQSIVEKSQTKRMQSAFAARAGAFSALLASWGARAPREAFEGRYGLYRLYESGDAAVLLDALGERYHGAANSIKKFPSCGCNHALIEATLQLVQQHGVSPGRVVGAIARISPYMNRIVGGVYQPGANPQVAAQFSAQYSVACAAMKGRLGLAEIDPEAARNPDVIALAHRVQIEVDETNKGQLVPAEVELLLDSGARLSKCISALPGSPESPLSELELEQKARECLGRGAYPLSHAATDRLLDRIARLEYLPDTSKLLQGL